MGLQTKNMHDIFNNLIEWILAKTDKITDFNIGSAARTLLEAISIQFEEFYFHMKQNVLYAIETSIYDSFGFDLKVSQAATGYVTVVFSERLPGTLVFPEGTVFCTSAIYGYIYYESTQEVYAPQGTQKIMIPVRCKTTGTIGNIPERAISTIVTTNTIIEEVYNETSFSNGSNSETSAERKRRFQDYIKTLARGTADAIVYGCLEVEGVSGAWVDDSYIGYVKLYAHNSEGELPEELRQAILQNLQDYRAGGIEVEVLPIVKKPIDISLDVLISNDYDAETYNKLLKDLVVKYMSEYSVANNLYMSDIIHTIKSAYEDVVVNITVSKGGDVSVGDNELVKPGDINISCINIKDWRS